MTDTTAIQAAQSLHDVLKIKLADRIKTGFVDLLPAEAFDKMVEGALDEFLNGPRHKRFNKRRDWKSTGGENGKGGYVELEEPIENNKYSPAEDSNTLPGMIHLELKQMAAGMIKESLSGDSRFMALSNTQSMIGDYILQSVETMVKDNANEFMMALVGRIVNNAFMATMNSLRSNNPGINIY